MKVKYNRISTLDQSLARQEINADSFDKVYSDKVSGTIPFFERKEAARLKTDILNKKVSCLIRIS
jgi:DNA invertase Pin-like site-specific DNA recombinase